MAETAEKHTTAEHPPPSNTLLVGRNEAYSSAVPTEIKGFFSSFHTAVTILRVAYTELDVTVEKERGSLDSFYDYLKVIEQHLYEPPNSKKPFIVAVEGLDGTGKSTLVETLAQELQHGCALATPTASMESVRPVFDKRGGPMARAFYMVSNYVLQHEARLECHQNPNTVFVVDRWYSSTCAYSIAWKNTTGGPESIDELDDTLFQWPRDLDAPNIMLLLCVDDETRRQRVRGREKAADYNPWDDRLSEDVDLGKRIMRCHERISGPNAIVNLNAQKSKTEVAHDAMKVVREHVTRHFQPWVYFKFRPLEFFRWTSSQVGLCDEKTGERLRHAPWAFQVALNTSDGCPSLRSVGIHTVDASGVLFFSRGHPGGGLGGTEDASHLASVVCILGDYPNEQQWRAEGILCSVTLEECDIMNTHPPASLVAQLSACEIEEKESTSHLQTQRRDFFYGHQESVARFRKNPLPQSQQETFVTGTRFVPLRMEVLVGGPSSPGGPRRYEWWRHGEKDKNGWNEARLIMPFSPPGGIACPIPRKPLLSVTVAITGTHCAGKRTLGDRVAHILGWRFDPELGDVLRDVKNIVADAHKLGYGSGTATSGDNMEWDDRIHFEERKRDDECKSSRIVETWHLGNLTWAFLRDDGLKRKQTVEREKLTSKTRVAIEEHLSKSCVLFVHLEASVETTIRRRKLLENSARMPMTNEEAECTSLHEDLQIGGRRLLGDFEDLDVPLLVLGNNSDGPSAVEESARKIIQFVNQNQWRRIHLQPALAIC